MHMSIITMSAYIDTKKLPSQEDTSIGSEAACIREPLFKIVYSEYVIDYHRPILHSAVHPGLDHQPS